jgi:hypothetical protein
MEETPDQKLVYLNGTRGFEERRNWKMTNDMAVRER